MRLMYEMDGVKLFHGDARHLDALADGSVHCCVNSPPYFSQRNYGVDGQIGLEGSVEEYIDNLVAVFREVKRVLHPSGTLWIDIGDSYASAGYSNQANTGGAGRENGKQHHTLGTGLPQKSLLMVPARVALALQQDGWLLRQQIIWAKGISFLPDYSGSVMPESVEDRCTTSHEYIFLLAKNPDYYFDSEAVREGNSPNSSKWGKSTITKTAQAQGNGRHGTTSFMSREMSNEEFIEKYLSNGRNLRSVWAINPQPFSYQMCTACGAVYDGAEYRRLREDADQRRVCACGRADAWLSHYAAYPEALVRPMIRAGSSEYGCCARCGNPYERVVERTQPSYWLERKAENYSGRKAETRPNDNYMSISKGRPDNSGVGYRHTATTGWAATCQCCQECDELGLSPSERKLIHASQRPGAREGMASAVAIQEIQGRPTIQGSESKALSQVSEDLRPMWQGVSREKNNIQILQQNLLDEMDVGEREGEQKAAEREEQIHRHTEGREIYLATSGSYGEIFGSETANERACSSHQWGQERQPDRESDGSNKWGTRQETQSLFHEIKPYPVRPAVVLDIFSGTGTTCTVAIQEGRQAIGVDLNDQYLKLSAERLRRAAATLRYGKQGAQERRKAAAVGVQQLELLEAAP